MWDTIIRGGTVVDGTGAVSFTADVAVKDGMIAEIGRVDGEAHHVIDADGAVVTPGWIDGHTHYDGQVTWDDAMEASASNGVTSVVMGNCGVGFAPVRPGEEAALIDLMEGVEAIPGTALYEGMPWGAWESFPDYLALLDRREYAVDVGAQLAHGPLRYYVMGRRALEDADANPYELRQMVALAEEAVRAGAVGFSTSRIQAHRAMSGHTVPGTFAPEAELRAIAEGLASGGGAVLQTITASGFAGVPGLPPETATMPDELRMFGRISRATGVPVNFTTLQLIDNPEGWREALRVTADENARGARLAPMTPGRGATALTSLATYHAFTMRPTFRTLAHLPLPELVAAMRRPEMKRAILAEPNGEVDPPGSMDNILPRLFDVGMDLTFPLTEPLDYEPTADRSITALAAAAGRDRFEYFYDFLLEDDGKAVAMYLGANYGYGNLEPCREMMLDPNTVVGLSDAGAHINFICDGSLPTFQLTHWVRDRSRGERLPIELVVAKSTSAVADLYQVADRGTITVGKRADLNVIDLEHLSNERPVLVHDLPAGGARFLQPATGYVATFVRGVQTRDRDKDTGARPGRTFRRSR